MTLRIGINKGHGFTLIEILIVLVILGIIAGAAIPNLGRTYSTILLNQTTHDIAYLMRYAQSRAIIQRRVLQLTIDPDKKQYRLQQENSPSEKNENKSSARFRPISGRLGRTFPIPAEIQILAQDTTVDFQPDGRIKKISWSLCQKKRCMTISTKEQSGYVQVLEEEN